MKPILILKRIEDEIQKLCLSLSRNSISLKGKWRETRRENEKRKKTMRKRGEKNYFHAMVVNPRKTKRKMKMKEEHKS